MLTIAPLLLAIHSSFKQASAAPEPTWVKAVDALFVTWDRPDSPGCALGVIQDGELVHARGFGSACLEHGVPITPGTVFDIGSTSKQFTAAAIGLLVADNRLGVEDEIHDWIPELADFGAKVTLDHLLHHTSGLPDYLGLMDASPPDWTTPEDALEALLEVKALRFEPGKRFEYSNTNFFLLSLVAERASGAPFREFVRTRLFEPLGMRDTLLFHDHTLVVPHRATAYDPRKGGGFAVDMSDFEQLGDGAVQTTVEDLVKWDSNFYTKQVGGEALHAFLHKTGTLTNKKSIDYARGLFVDSFRGLPRVSHGGAWAGYRAQLMRFPEQKTSIVCLSNLSSMDPNGLCESVAALVLGEKMSAER